MYKLVFRHSINIINDANGNTKVIRETVTQRTKKNYRRVDRRALELNIYGNIIHEPDEVSPTFNKEDAGQRI